MIDEEQKRKMTLLARGLGEVSVDISKVEYYFLEGSVMITSEGHLVGMINRGVWDVLMTQSLEGKD